MKESIQMPVVPCGAETKKSYIQIVAESFGLFSMDVGRDFEEPTWWSTEMGCYCWNGLFFFTSSKEKKREALGFVFCQLFGFEISAAVWF